VPLPDSCSPRGAVAGSPSRFRQTAWTPVNRASHSFPRRDYQNPAHCPAPWCRAFFDQLARHQERSFIKIVGFPSDGGAQVQQRHGERHELLRGQVHQRGRGLLQVHKHICELREVRDPRLPPMRQQPYSSQGLIRYRARGEPARRQRVQRDHGLWRSTCAALLVELTLESYMDPDVDSPPSTRVRHHPRA